MRRRYWVLLVVFLQALGCGVEQDEINRPKAAAPPDVSKEFKAYVRAELNDAWNDTSTSRIHRFCRTDSETAVRILFAEAAKIDPEEDPYHYHRVIRLSQQLPLAEGFKELIPHINHPNSDTVTTLASTIYGEYLRARPSGAFYIPEDIAQETTPHFANFAFEAFDLSRALERYAAKDSDRRVLVRKVLLADHLVRDFCWRRRNRCDIDPDDLAECRTLLSELSESDLWWVKRFVLKAQRMYTPLSDPDIERRLKADSDKRIWFRRLPSEVISTR